MNKHQESNGSAQDAAVRQLQRLAEKIAAELEEAKRAADRVATLSTDLASVRRALALTTGDHVIVPGTGKLEVTGQPVVMKVTKPMTETVLEMLRETSRPMHVKEILAKLRTTHPDAKEMTIVSHLVRFTQAGKVKRTAPGTYQFVGLL